MSSVTKVINPKTNRWIAVGGSVYKKLVEQGVRLDHKKTKESKAFVPIPAQQYQTPTHFEKYPVEKSDTPWGQKKPQRVGDRKKIEKECGSSCFLFKKDSTLRFPICNKELPCTYNCRGIKAASSRAGEWKYDKVLKTSKELSKEFGCYKKKK